MKRNPSGFSGFSLNGEHHQVSQEYNRIIRTPIRFLRKAQLQVVNPEKPDCACEIQSAFPLSLTQFLFFSVSRAQSGFSGLSVEVVR